MNESRLTDALQRTQQLLAGKYMVFKLAGEVYGLPLLTVREIIGLLDITRIPLAPSYVRGVINLRGKVMPVLDLRARFGMEPADDAHQTVIIILQYFDGDQEVSSGLLVDEVVEVLEIAAAQIGPPPEWGDCREQAFVLGIGKHEERVIFLLDSAQLVLSGRPDEARLSAGRGSDADRGSQ